MPRFASQAAQAQPRVDEAVRGLLAPLAETSSAAIPVNGGSSAEVTEIRYTCRAYSEENRPGFHSNEDRFFCEEKVLNNQTEQIDMFIVGVLDGHDGASAADLVVDELPYIVFNKCVVQGDGVHVAHEKAFKDIEDKLYHKYQSSADRSSATAGCCANSCLMWGRYLWCSNLGDCRAVYIPLGGWEEGSSDNALTIGALCWMSRDLKASVPYEVDRIERAGWKVHDGRVEGLEPTRTIGDFDVKAKLPPGVISIIPETRAIDIVAEGRKMSPSITLAQGILVQGTDGVWDCLCGQDIVNTLRTKARSIQLLQKYMATCPQKEYNPESKVASVLDRLASDIVTFAQSKGSSDDCTAIVTAVSAKAEPGS